MGPSYKVQIKGADLDHSTGKPTNYYSQLDGLRFLAVTGVLFQHFVTPLFSHYFLTGHAGVDLFFVISGFLITENLIRLKSAHDFGRAAKIFYARRILRIFPLYFFYLLILTVFFYPFVKTSLPYAFTYTINFYDINHDLHPLVGHLWSLSVEEQFYVFWPFLILLMPRTYLKSAINATFIFAFIFIVFNFNYVNPVYNYFHTLSCMIALSTGGILAYYKVFEKERLSVFLLSVKKGWLLLFICIHLIISIGFQSHLIPERVLIILRLGMCFIGFYLVGRVCSGNGFKGLFGKFLNLEIIKKIGQISYGIYIYHYLVAFLLMPYISQIFDHISPFGAVKYIKYNHTFFEFPLLMIITVLISLLSYYFFESPILALKKYFS